VGSCGTIPNWVFKVGLGVNQTIKNGFAITPEAIADLAALAPIIPETKTLVRERNVKIEKMYRKIQFGGVVCIAVFKRLWCWVRLLLDLGARGRLHFEEIH